MNYNVVVVDDEIVLLLHSILIKAIELDKSPKTFNSVIKALDFLECLSEKTMPVLLFLDINMPVKHGWYLLDISHKGDFDKKTEVVVLTSSIDQKRKLRPHRILKQFRF